MARRRKKNPLLMRILIISIGAHAIALPIAARFGAFDKIRKEFGDSRVVMVTMPPIEAEKPAVEKKAKKEKATPTAKKSASTTAKSSAASSKSNLPQPKVVAGSGDGGEGDGPSVDPNGGGKAGVLPTGPVIPTPPSPPADNPTPKPVEPTPEPKPPAPELQPEPPKPEPRPAPTPVAKPRKFVQVETTFAPEPVIPDDLRTEPLDKTLIVEADVDADGKPENIKIVDSTGIRTLDDIGLDTARRYRFRPAALDDTPVTGHVRFRILFKVE